MNDAAPGETQQLLDRLRQGDDEALHRLIERDLADIETRVRRRLGPQLRARCETHDLVQDTVIELLRHGPRLSVADPGHFRALLARIVENVIRGKHDRFTAACRDQRREQSLSPAIEGGGPTASQSLAAREQQDLLELAVSLLAEDERQIVLWREFDRLPYGAIGRKLGIEEDAARMRHRRGLRALGRIVRRLESGRFGELPQLDASSEPPVS